MNGLLVSLKDNFARSAELRRDELRDRQIRFVEQERRKRLDEERDEKSEIAEAEMLAEFVLATDVEVQTFTVKLDTYDTATVAALMENQEELELVRERIKAMLEKAYVLPDGRRVFKTEDGTRVFDEYGGEVRDIDPDRIENARPRWERFAKDRASEKVLIKEHRGLTDYQEELDTARERAGGKGFTAKELKDRDKALTADMPDRARKHLADPSNVPAMSPEHSPASERPAIRSGIRMDMPSL